MYAYERHEAVRWSSSFLAVVALHALIVFAVLYWPSPAPLPAGEPMAAMVVELAPLPTAPPTPTEAVEPGEIQEAQEALPAPEPEPEPVAELPEIPEVAHAEAVLPPAPELAPEPVEPEPEQRQEQQEQAPPIVEAPPAEVAAAPRQGAVSLAPSQAVASWQAVLLGHLEAHKRYPRESRRRRQEAMILVRVKMHRDGSIIDYQLEQGSRYAPLNAESLALISRAAPLPPPPAAVQGEVVEFVVPVEFSLRR